MSCNFIDILDFTEFGLSRSLSSSCTITYTGDLLNSSFYYFIESDLLSFASFMPCETSSESLDATEFTP
jgi:hypothetical protein